MKIDPPQLEIDPSCALLFSPNGHYLLLQGRDAFKNDVCQEIRRPDRCSAMLFDLRYGLKIGLSLQSHLQLSLNIKNEQLEVYRLKRGGAIEMNSYRLPYLTESERFHIAFLPASCRCATCGRPFEESCHITVVEHEGAKSIYLGHTPFGVGHTDAKKEVCEPLILRVKSAPVPVEEGTSLVESRSHGVFPPILEINGDQVAASHFSSADMSKFTDSSFLALILIGLFHHLFGTMQQAKAGGVPGEPKVEISKPDKATDTNSETAHEPSKSEATSKPDPKSIPGLDAVVGALKPLLRNRTRQMVSHMRNYVDTKENKQVPAQNIESHFHQLEKDATEALQFGELNDTMQTMMNKQMKSMLGDDFPFDSMHEMMAEMQELTEEDLSGFWSGLSPLLEFHKISGIGCSIPIFIYSFYHGNEPSESEVQEKDIKWSLASDKGWIEEDVARFFDRMIGRYRNFEDARTWYDFPAYAQFGSFVRTDSVAKLMLEQTPKAERLRRMFAPWLDDIRKNTPALAGAGSNGGEEQTSSDQQQKKADREAKAESGWLREAVEAGDEDVMLYLRDLSDGVKDVVPGLGKMANLLTHMMLTKAAGSRTMLELPSTTALEDEEVAG